jgi:hypothetical protein
MREPAAPPAAEPADTSALHAVWFTVVKPRVVAMPDGAPAFELVHTAQTLAEATAYVSRIPGGAIVANVVVFVNPQGVAIIRTN